MYAALFVGLALAGKASGAALQNDGCTHRPLSRLKPVPLKRLIVPTLRVGMHPLTFRVDVFEVD